MGPFIIKIPNVLSQNFGKRLSPRDLDGFRTGFETVKNQDKINANPLRNMNSAAGDRMSFLIDPAIEQGSCVKNQLN